MLLTKRSAGGGGTSPSALVGSLARGVSRAIPTMDRRAFLRRSGLGVGAGLAAGPARLALALIVACSLLTQVPPIAGIPLAAYLAIVRFKVPGWLRR